MPRFKIVKQPMGSGWISLHVAVDEHYNWKDTRSEICLTLDAENADDLGREIDELIEELNGLKGSAKRRFAALKPRATKLT